jgi:adenylylsulfate kinase
MYMKKLLIMGLPGTGKTTLSIELAKALGGVHFNADEIRKEINKDLKFSVEDRLEQARRMGVLCDIVTRSGQFAVADFVCPTRATRAAFGDALIIWVNRTPCRDFADTTKLFEAPDDADIVVTDEGSALYWANQIKKKIIPTFNSKAPTAFMLGRYQPFHDGHKNLIAEAINRVGQACIAIRDTQGTDEKNPFNNEEVEANIRKGMVEYEGKYTIIRVPNITNIFYGRDVGYKIEQIDLDKTLQNISATKIRNEILK